MIADGKPKKNKSNAEVLVRDTLIAAGIPPVEQYPFATGKQWVFDFAYPTIKLAIELDGVHHLNRGQRDKDLAKRNFAIECGWRVLVYPADRVFIKKRLPRIIDQIHRCVCEVEPDAEEAGIVLAGD